MWYLTERSAVWSTESHTAVGQTGRELQRRCWHNPTLSALLRDPEGGMEEVEEKVVKYSLCRMAPITVLLFLNVCSMGL